MQVWDDQDNYVITYKDDLEIQLSLYEGVYNLCISNSDTFEILFEEDLLSKSEVEDAILKIVGEQISIPDKEFLEKLSKEFNDN
ncbi:MAG: hypothetical protein WC136_04955 [Sphaerochaeta sp.]